MINWSKCTFTHFVLPPPLPTLTIWFSPDHKRNISDRVVKEIGTLFSLDHTLYTSDYDSDSVTSENQPLWFAVLKWIAVCVPFISRSKLSAVWTAQALCLKNLSAIQTAWAICAKALLSFPKSGVICVTLHGKTYTNDLPLNVRKLTDT